MKLALISYWRNCFLHSQYCKQYLINILQFRICICIHFNSALNVAFIYFPKMLLFNSKFADFHVDSVNKWFFKWSIFRHQLIHTLNSYGKVKISIIFQYILWYFFSNSKFAGAASSHSKYSKFHIFIKHIKPTY